MWMTPVPTFWTSESTASGKQQVPGRAVAECFAAVMSDVWLLYSSCLLSKAGLHDRQLATLPQQGMVSTLGMEGTYCSACNLGASPVGIDGCSF